MFHWLTCAVLLTGSVSFTDEHGLIGILYSSMHGMVIKVYKGSPAERAGLEPYDIIINSDPPGISGEAHTFVHLIVQRKGVGLLEFDIERVPDREISR